VLHKLMALLVSSAVVIGGVGMASAAQGDPVKPVQTSVAKAATKNTAPLAPGGAAGIQQAQGSSSNDWLLIGGSILAGVGILLLVSGGGDEDAVPSTSSTN